MKQLALTQTKWTAESSHVYAARWKQMLCNLNTSVTGREFLQRNRRDLESASFSSAHLLQESLDFPWSNIIMWEQRLTEPWPTWPWVRIQIDFFVFFLPQTNRDSSGFSNCTQSKRRASHTITYFHKICNLSKRGSADVFNEYWLTEWCDSGK